MLLTFLNMQPNRLTFQYKPQVGFGIYYNTDLMNKHKIIYTTNTKLKSLINSTHFH